ncbi:Hpt domain-containing protein [Prolixibacteraceae bacterium Z1-6]|uniref:Hpt domain-containing protein n=1 Tax=Draconibacterium aestuarii TaxID=2998507 RepID=A0A9X3J5R2_9BACT|nr:Hpt domain-containing protein [Prolixibacteraceae bacterium Z1-6]
MDKHSQLIHTKQIDAISGDDTGFKIELINIFLEQIPEFISNMTNSYNEENWKVLAREAHTAKSSALTFGMDETGDLLKNIQLHTENNDLDFLPDLLTKVVDQLKTAVTELEELKKSL